MSGESIQKLEALRGCPTVVHVISHARAIPGACSVVLFGSGTMSRALATKPQLVVRVTFSHMSDLTLNSTFAHSVSS